MTVSVHRQEPEGSFSELIGELADEAALMGVLERLYTHGARLLTVERFDEAARDSGSNLKIIMKDGKIYKNTLN